jgi:hypothetical protein
MRALQAPPNPTDPLQDIPWEDDVSKPLPDSPSPSQPLQQAIPWDDVLSKALPAPPSPSNLYRGKMAFEGKPYRQLEDGNFQCLLCYKCVERRVSMVQHLKGHTSCSKCGKCFSGSHSSSSHKKHESTCSGPKVVPTCEFCSKTFQFKSYKLKHIVVCPSRPM